jgi:hypothetical protein
MRLGQELDLMNEDTKRVVKVTEELEDIPPALGGGGLFEASSRLRAQFGRSV